MNEVDKGAQRILVIKHGALGDLVLATGSFKAIRAHHFDAHIVFLTTAPFESFGRDCGYFNEVWLDTRPRPLQVGAWLALSRNLSDGRFRRVYDLQTSNRSGWYFRLMANPKPEWSGIARGCSHPHDNPDRDHLHTIDRQAEQLRHAGIDFVPQPGVQWLDAPVSDLVPSNTIAILVAGGSPQRPGKRWPVKRYAALAQALLAEGMVPVLLGTEAEREVTSEIARRCDGLVDLTGRTTLAEVASLCRRAAVVIGNDTGPMHISALTGSRTIVLFSHDSDPALCAPRGPRVSVVRRERLDELAVEEVLKKVRHSE